MESNKFENVNLEKLQNNKEVLSVLERYSHLTPILVGGFLKYLLGEAETFSDVDIILVNSSGEDFLKNESTNYFGGARIVENNIQFDVWNLRDTYFLNHIENPTIEDYLNNLTKNEEFKKAYYFNKKLLVSL